MTQAFFPLLLLTNDNHMNLKELLEYENISPAGSRTSRPAAAAIARNEGALIPMVLLDKRNPNVCLDFPENGRHFFVCSWFLTFSGSFR